MDRVTRTSKPRGQAATSPLSDGAAVCALLQQAGGKPLEDRPSNAWTEVLADQVMEVLWQEGLSPDEAEKHEKAVVAGLIGIAPKDELEGMMAVQLIAAHNASLAAYRRAMDVNHPFDRWREAITQANSLSRTFSTLLDALHRYRGKSQQKITVEHVHRQPDALSTVPLGGGTRSQAARIQAARMIASGEGVSRDSEEQPHAR
ncbi:MULTISPECIES: hypothetical protein [unclassified Beijerinckia]|uniref:hypothetical protein n=1 Tax=unclassified Beijerinckia TaxID=2638183 RepID=UPI00089666C9|nr:MULTISPECIES: hypothetical protein [unclassified Beijerinckia]MDH7797152.1 hypothetical protein [Beijerinckia sp. GAS462]SEC74253.1 hypothetical protein SAMN05443249_3444 [Beijerinckia sp. 28-YEA-48]